MSFNTFYKQLSSFIKYLRLTSNLDSRFPDASIDECEAAGDCLICREKMEFAKKLPCGHIFHLDCLRMWLQHQQTCPLCRAEIPVVTTTTPTTTPSVGNVPPVDLPPVPAATPMIPNPTIIQTAGTLGTINIPGAGDNKNIDTGTDILPGFFLVIESDGSIVYENADFNSKELRKLKKVNQIYFI